MQHDTAPHAGDGGELLADAVSWNALFSGATGTILLVFGTVLDTRLGVAAWMLTGLGAGLVLFAGITVWLLAGLRRLVAGARFVVAADLAWVAGAALVLAVAPSALSPAGRVTLALVTAAVAVIAIVQLLGLRRIRSGPVTGTSPLALRASRVVAAPVDQVWDAVADAGDYARFAPGIAGTAIVSREGQGMVRVCTNERGGRWAETCTLWDAASRYQMTVDTASYPAYYRMLLHELSQTWSVEPAPGGTRVSLAFDGAVKLGALGRLAARALGRPRRLEAILDAYERELTATSRTA